MTQTNNYSSTYILVVINNTSAFSHETCVMYLPNSDLIRCVRKLYVGAQGDERNSRSPMRFTLYYKSRERHHITIFCSRSTLSNLVVHGERRVNTEQSVSVTVVIFGGCQADRIVHNNNTTVPELTVASWVNTTKSTTIHSKLNTNITTPVTSPLARLIRVDTSLVFNKIQY